MYCDNTTVLFCNALLLPKWTIKLIGFWKVLNKNLNLCVYVCVLGAEASVAYSNSWGSFRKPDRAASREWELGPTVGGIWLQDTGGHRSNNYTLNLTFFFCPSHTFRCSTHKHTLVHLCVGCPPGHKHNLTLTFLMILKVAHPLVT